MNTIEVSRDDLEKVFAEGDAHGVREVWLTDRRNHAGQPISFRSDEKWYVQQLHKDLFKL